MPWTFFTKQGVRDLPEIASTTVEVGTTLMYIGASPPGGWHLCQGQVLTIASNPLLAALFVANSLVFPGAFTPGVTFRLPDMRNRFPACHDTGDINFTPIGKLGGANAHSHTGATGNSHTHFVNNHIHEVEGHVHNTQHTHGTPPHSHGPGGLVVPNNGDSNNIRGGSDRSGSTRSHNHNVGGQTTSSSIQSSDPRAANGITVVNTSQSNKSGLNAPGDRGASTGTSNPAVGTPSDTISLDSSGADSVPRHITVNYIIKAG